MARVMGDLANTPEKQHLARQVVQTIVAQSPDLHVTSLVEASPGQLLQPRPTYTRRPGQNPGGRPRTGKRVGRHGKWTPADKTNSRPLGQAVLRRDCPASVKVEIASILNSQGVKTRADLNQVSSHVWARLEQKYQRPRSFLKNCWINQEKFSQSLSSQRPKGCGFQRPKNRETAGSRVSTQPKDQGTRRIPLQGVYFKTRTWIKKHASTVAYPRPAQMMSQFKMYLVQEINIQRALQEAHSPAFMPFVLQACEQKVQFLNSGKYKQIQDYQSQTLLPSIGARRRRGQKLCKDQGSQVEAKLLCQVQWQTTDYAFWLNQASDPVLLQPFIENPESWIQHKDQTWLIESDATALWVRLSGQEGVLVPDCQLASISNRRKLSRYQRQAKTEAEKQLIQALVDHHVQNDKLPEQVHFQAQPGGDKYRLTLIASIAREKWFQPGQAPVGHLLPFVLLVPCSQHTRLEDLDSQGRFTREIKYKAPDDTLIHHKPGDSARGRLGPWVQFRAEYPQHPFWSQGTVWGQPRAWQDQIISSWLQERLSSLCQPQSIHMCDCLEAMWSEASLFQAYKRLPRVSFHDQ